MNGLEPKYTKLRVYVKPDQFRSVKAILGALEPESSESFVDAAVLFVAADGDKVLEVVALRQNIHQRVVPMVQEAFPGAFLTMEALCGITIPNQFQHKLY